MKIKNITFVAISLAAAGFLTSCGSSSQVASSFGTRKYTKGYFVNTPAPATTVASGSTAKSEPVSNTEQVKSIAPVSTVVSNSTGENTAVATTPLASSNSPTVNTEVARTRNLHTVVETARSMAYAQVQAPKTAVVQDKAESIENTAQVQRNGDSWFQKHTVLAIILIVVFIGLIVLLIAAGAPVTVTATP